MLHLKDFYPIDREKVKKRWDEIMNVPNNCWQDLDVDRKIDVINDIGYPGTLRTIQLNILPALVIEIIRKQKK